MYGNEHFQGQIEYKYTLCYCSSILISIQCIQKIRVCLGKWLVMRRN